MLRATARVLVRDGYAHANTNEIARVAGVSVGSLYQYFPNKDALVMALIEEHIGKMRGLLSSLAAGAMALPLAEATELIVHAMVASHRLDPKLHRVVIEQVPPAGRPTSAFALEEQTRMLVRLYLEAHGATAPPGELDAAAFVTVTAVEALAHTAVLHHPAMLVDGSLERHAVRMIVSYLAPLLPDSRPAPAAAMAPRARKR